MGIVLTGPQMQKKLVNPLMVSYVAQGVQQTTIASKYKHVNDS